MQIFRLSPGKVVIVCDNSATAGRMLRMAMLGIPEFTRRPFMSPDVRQHSFELRSELERAYDSLLTLEQEAVRREEKTDAILETHAA